MSKARDLADLAKNANDRLDDVATSDGALSNRNLIINGAMQVAQRGTSFSANGYSLDHWYSAFGGTATVTQDATDVPSNFKYAIKTATSAASSFATFYQPFEALDYARFKGETVTISLYVKVNSTFVGNISIDMQSGDTADTLLSGTWAANDAKTITPTTTWQRYSVTLTVGTSNGVRLNIGPSQAQASGAEYSFTGVQLEVGDTATPFEHRSYGDELARCERYYETGRSKLYCNTSMTGMTLYVPHRTTKRTNPTVTVVSGSHQPTTIEEASVEGIKAYRNTGNEISYEYTADAEL